MRIICSIKKCKKEPTTNLGMLLVARCYPHTANAASFFRFSMNRYLHRTLTVRYPLRMISSLPAPAGHHGRMPTLIAQPWFVDPEADLHLITRLFGFSRLHCQCLDDICATCLLRIPASFQRHSCKGIRFVQLLWHTPAVPSRKSQSKDSKTDQPHRSYPHALYVYLVASSDINLHTFILQEASQLKVLDIRC